MRWSDGAKVGLTALVAAALLASLPFVLRSTAGVGKTYLRTVLFADAQGLGRGAVVRVRGVEVGAVERVGLWNRRHVEVVLRINNDYAIRPTDSVRIVGGLFGFSQPYVEITPEGRAEPLPPGEVLVGEAGPSTATIVERSEQLLTNLNGLIGKMNRLTEGLARTAGDPAVRRSLTRTARNFETASESGVIVARNMARVSGRAGYLINSFDRTSAQLNRTLRRADTLLSSFGGTAAESREVMRDTRALVQDTRGAVREASALARNSNRVIENAGGLVTDARGALTENREKLREVLDTVGSSLKQLDSTLVETRSLLADPELRTNLKETSANVRDATETLKAITTDVRGLTGDPKVQEDLRVTLSSLRDVTEQAAAVFRRVRGVVGGGGNAVKTARTIARRVGGTEFNVSASHRPEGNRSRLDLDATIPWSMNTFYRLGFFDFGENTRFNAQAGQAVRPGIWTRYGIHASKLGVGLDIGRPERPPFTLDLYGVDRPRVDVRGFIPVGGSLDLSLGLDNATRSPDPVFGLRYRR